MARIFAPFACATVLIGVTSAAHAVPIIEFDDLSINTGTITYLGVGGALVETGIGVDTLLAFDTPSNAGSHTCVNCVLNFTTGNNTAEPTVGPPFFWTWAGGGAFTINGSVPDAGINSNQQLLTGSFTSATAFSPAISGTMSLNFGGFGADTKNPVLLTYLGLSPTTQFQLAQTGISATAIVGPTKSIKGASLMTRVSRLVRALGGLPQAAQRRMLDHQKPAIWGIPDEMRPRRAAVAEANAAELRERLTRMEGRLEAQEAVIADLRQALAWHCQCPGAQGRDKRLSWQEMPRLVCEPLVQTPGLSPHPPSLPTPCALIGLISCVSRGRHVKAVTAAGTSRLKPVDVLGDQRPSAQRRSILECRQTWHPLEDEQRIAAWQRRDEWHGEREVLRPWMA